MPVVNPDFDTALATATVFLTDPLILPSGRLVAAEPPGTAAPGEVALWAFAETVAPGEYPVEILRDEGCLVAARVIIRREPVVQWRPARVASQPDWDHVYFPVDGAAGSFGSVEVFEVLTDPETAEDFISDYSFESSEPHMTYTDDAGELNLIAFNLGGGGRFETWIGYSKSGEPASFLTDYGALAG